MSELEKLAKDLFINYAASVGDIRANWNFLSSARKLNWMKDALNFSEYYTNKLVLTIKPQETNATIKTSYGLGFEMAAKNEAKRLVEKVKQTHQELVNDYEDYIYILNKQNRK